MGETATFLKESEEEQGRETERMRSALLSTIVENVKGQPSNKAFSERTWAGGQRGLPGGGGLGVSWV